MLGTSFLFAEYTTIDKIMVFNKFTLWNNLKLNKCLIGQYYFRLLMAPLSPESCKQSSLDKYRLKLRSANNIFK